MGYNTRYHLETSGNEEEIKNLIISLDEDDDYYLLQLLRYEEYEAKWYSHEDDLKNLSLYYPNILFKLFGIGENWGDFWIKYFKNGKMKNLDCELYHKEEFNEKDLI